MRKGFPCHDSIMIWENCVQYIPKNMYTILLCCELCHCTFLLDLMMTSSNGKIFRVTGHLCGEFTGPRWIPHTKASDRSFDVFFDLRLNERLSKQSWGWWFETLSRPLWRQCNVRDRFNYVNQGHFARSGAIASLCRCQFSNPEEHL